MTTSSDRRARFVMIFFCILCCFLREASAASARKTKTMHTEVTTNGDVLMRGHKLVTGTREADASTMIHGDGRATATDDIMRRQVSMNKGASYVIAHSTESTPYQLWQSMASYHSFTTTPQRSATKFARLVTRGFSNKGRSESLRNNAWHDWVSDKGVPSYFYDRDGLADQYTPFNKPDVFAKWMASPDAPKEDVLVILDPDSFLVHDLSPEVDLIQPGKGRAAQSWYMGQAPAVREFYRDFCESIGRKPTERLDLVAVPYMIHRTDMERLAPLWRELTVKIKKSKWADIPLPMDIRYTAEMYAFNFAAAQLGIWFDINEKLQVRDVDDVPSQPMWYTIHTGRAWFPNDYEHGKRWKASSFMQTLTQRGYEVWCKCNETGREIIPWPLPPNMDPVSRQTLTVLHDTFEKFGHPDGFH